MLFHKMKPSIPFDINCDNLMQLEVIFLNRNIKLHMYWKTSTEPVE